MTWQLEVSTSTATALVIGASILCASLALLESRRPGPRRGSRIAAAIGAVLALLGLALGPSRDAPPRSDLVTLLTPGARGSALGPAYAIGTSAPGATTIPDLAWLLRNRPEVRRIVVRGWGLDEDEWPGADAPLPVTIEPELAPAPAGITAIQWPAAISLGEELVVRGRARAECVACALVLSHAGVPLDSARIYNRDTTFTLRARPRAVGPWRPVLAFSPRDAAPAETLAVEVRAPVPPRVVVVDASPTFESRFLKDWLGRQGATVAVRTRLARARTGVAALNAPTDVALDPAALAEWDVLVLRATSLPGLVPAERRAIVTAVRDGALGVVLVVDSAVATSLLPDLLSHADPRAFVGPARGAVRRTRLSWDGVTTAPVAVPTGGASPADGPGILARNEANQAMATSLPIGAGRLVVSLVPDAAAWMLAGDSTSFGAWWSRLLGAVRVEGRKGVAWSAEGGPWFLDHPATVRALATAAPKTAVLEEAGLGPDTLTLLRDRSDSSQSTARLRPHTSGWLSVGGAGGLLIFAYDPSRWQAIQAQRRIESTLARAGAGPGEDGSHRRRTPLRWAFYLLFVGAVAWLWLSVPMRGDLSVSLSAK